MFIHLHRHVGLYISRTVLVGTVLHACELGLGLTRLQASLSVLIQKQRGLRELLCRWPSITEWEVHININA